MLSLQKNSVSTSVYRRNDGCVPCASRILSPYTKHHNKTSVSLIRIRQCQVSAKSQSDAQPLAGTQMGAGTENMSLCSKIDSVPLLTEAEIDYTILRNALKEQDFRRASGETRALIIRLAGEVAIKRGWVFYAEVRTISVSDMLTINNLWLAASDGKFGYSVQKDIFDQCKGDFGEFFRRLDWNAEREWPAGYHFSLDAPRGHLPLTNTQFGTALISEFMNHPAWQK